MAVSANRQTDKIEQYKDDRNIPLKNIRYSPRARPLIKDISRDLGHPDTAEPIVVRPPGVGLLLVGAHPVPRLRGL